MKDHPGDRRTGFVRRTVLTEPPTRLYFPHPPNPPGPFSPRHRLHSVKNQNRDLLIALSLLPFLSPSRTRLLLEHFDPVTTACSASPTLLQGLMSLTPEQALQVNSPLTSESRRIIDRVRESVVTIVDDDYPNLLREIADPPLVLHCAGDRSLLDMAAVSVVGSRRATPYGINVAEMLARELALAGACVISGLARGIDAAAHRSALDAGGKTIAVLGTGIDVIYPRSNTRLFQRIVSEGLVVSDFPPGSPPLPEHFPMRNRLISGLSLGTVIVEATARSGSLITARMAAEQNREVFAVPGSIFARTSEGTHRLVQYGAKLVHDVNDIFDELPAKFERAVLAEAEPPPQELRDVLAAFTKEEGLHIDSAARKLGRTPSAIAAPLLQLELGGWLRALPGARYMRVR
jgi:DNA processing protein